MCIILAVTQFHANAAVITPSDQGWYTSAGHHVTASLNYLAGEDSEEVELRNWFVFDMSTVGTTIGNATLALRLSPEHLEINNLTRIKGVFTPFTRALGILF